MEKRWIWPFELEEQIGEGGMGVVYRARYVKSDRRVALKLLPHNRAPNPTIIARFERELEMLKDLRHPHIVHCFGGTCEGEQQFYAMELVEGGTVESLLEKQGKLSWEQTVDYALELCSALEYAHERGIVHRDIKPANLLLTKSGRIKLSDFGLALMTNEHRLTREGRTMGTFLYMAPEQICGKPAISNKTDLYSTGCLLFEMLTGQTPFHGEAAAGVLHQHLNTPAPRVRSMVRDCPPELDKLIADLLEKHPDDRPVDATLVGKCLHALQLSAAVREASPSPGPPLSSVEMAQCAPTKSIAIDPQRLDEIPPQMPNAERLTQIVPYSVPAAAADSKAPLITGVLMLAGAVAVWLYAFSTPARPSRAELLWITALQHSQAPVRQVAAHALGEVGPVAHEAISRLAEALKDPDAGVRTEAATALGKIGIAAKSTSHALAEVQQKDANAEVRQRATIALEKVQGRSLSSPLKTVVSAILCVALAAGGLWILIKRPFEDFGDLISVFSTDQLQRFRG